jgi:Icc-related predicted phosphoesterase/uncharacterized protein YprB with RNaseH-like and TPR domain
MSMKRKPTIPQPREVARAPRILAFSDWRTQRIRDVFDFVEAYTNRFGQEIDLIVYAGDDVKRFQVGSTNHFSALARLTTHKKVLAVLGNDCLPDDRKVLQAEGVVNLHRQPFEFGGYTFIGQEGATSPPGHILYEESRLERRLRRRLGKGSTILVSHTPPHGLLDLYVRFGTRHIGSTAIRKLVEERLLAMVICGHSHLNGGKHCVHNGCTVLNVSSHDKADSVGNFCVFTPDREINDECHFDTNSLREYSPLLKLQQFGHNRLESFEQAGITTLEQIIEENRARLKNIPHVYDYHVDLWIKQARSILSGTPVINQVKASRLIGSKYILYDIETDLSNKNVFLIGCYVSSTKEQREFFQKNCHSRLIHDFVQFLDRYPDHRLVSFSNCRFEHRALTRLLAQEGLACAAIEAELDLGMHIQELLLGEFRYGLKELAGAIGFNRTSTLDGEQVGGFYTRFLMDGIEPDWDSIVQYDREDILQMKHIVDVLLAGNLKA